MYETWIHRALIPASYWLHSDIFWTPRLSDFGSFWLPGPVRQQNHQEGFPEKNLTTEAEEGVVHKGANAEFSWLELVNSLVSFCGGNPFDESIVLGQLHTTCWLPPVNASWIIQSIDQPTKWLNPSTVRSYIKCAVEYCEKAGNKRLWKTLVFSTLADAFVIFSAFWWLIFQIQ